MSLTRPIPIEAWPVVEVLRRDVPRPEWRRFRGSPRRLRTRSPLWPNAKCCPMGLHWKAINSTPVGICFPIVRRWEATAFAKWWDEQSGPKAAVAAVWDREQGWTGDEVPGCDSAEAITKEMK